MPEAQAEMRHKGSMILTLVAQFGFLRGKQQSEALGKGICGTENRPAMFNLRRIPSL